MQEMGAAVSASAGACRGIGSDFVQAGDLAAGKSLDLASGAATWVDGSPSAVDNRLRTDDGFLTSEMSSTDNRDWIGDLFSTYWSPITNRIAGRLTATTAWAAYVTALVVLGDFVAPDVIGPYTNFEVPNWPHELVGGFLAILLVFRTNQAYERFWEGRKLWADLTAQTRKLSHLVIAHVPSNRSPAVLAHISAFPTALKMHLRGYRSEAELKGIYASFLGVGSTDSASLVAKSNNMPLTIIMSISHLLAPIRGLDRSAHYEMVWELAEQTLDDLTNVVSGCEKIKCTPLPLSYSRHTSRFFSLFTLSLPFALVKQTSPLIVPLTVLLVTWVLLATNEVGHIIEDPFGNANMRNPGRGAASMVTREWLKKEFAAFDADGKGFVTVRDVERGLGSVSFGGEDMKVPLPLDTKAALVNGVTALASPEGAVGFQAFNTAWKVCVGSERTRKLETMPLASYADSVFREVFYHWSVAREGGLGGWGQLLDADSPLRSAGDKAFESLDVDRSGGIDEEELRGGMPVWAKDDDVRREFERMDSDGDGVIDAQEMAIAWLKSSASVWLNDKGFGQYASMFDELEMDMDSLVRLTVEDLANIGIQDEAARLKIVEEIEALKQEVRNNQG